MIVESITNNRCARKVNMYKIIRNIVLITGFEMIVFFNSCRYKD